MGMPHGMAGRAFPRNVRAAVANLFGLAAAFASLLAVALCVVLLARGGGWSAVGLALLVLAANPAGETAAEVICPVDDAYPPVRWWAWRICFAASSIVAGLALNDVW